MTASLPFLPYGRHSIDDDDIAAVVEVLQSDFLTTGPTVAAFEQSLAEATGAEHAIAVSNGTAALHLAAIALDLGPGDSVIVPTLTFLATANAARYVGAEVVFADVDPSTGLLSADSLAQAMRQGGDNVRAVFPVHLNGQSADMAALKGVDGASELIFVEDSCHALGGMQLSTSGQPRPVGSCTDSNMSVFSFHPVKIVAMGEGGAITTNDAGLAERLRRLRNIGMVREPSAFQLADQALASDGSPNPWYYEMPELGFNCRASDLHCALGLSQLKKLNRFAERRNQLIHRYRDSLASLSPLVEPVPEIADVPSAWHLFVVHIDFPNAGMDRAQVMHALRERGVGTQVHYLPVHRQPYYRERYGDIDLPGADAYYASVLSLPLFVDMLDTDVDYVVEVLTDILTVRGSRS